MEVNIRDYGAADLAAVHAINESAVPHVNSIPLSDIQRFAGQAIYFKIAEVDTGVAGFLVALPPGVAYPSLNYLWFSSRYSEFLYVDRVAVSKPQQGVGIGRALYEDIQSFARGRFSRIACEVNTRPRNETSLAFHERFGFEPVGEQETEGGSKTVRLMIKKLSG